MTAFDPRGQRTQGLRGLGLSWALAVIAALLVGAMLQEVRWRGGFGVVALSH